jgi:hypothetical protein
MTYPGTMARPQVIPGRTNLADPLFVVRAQLRRRVIEIS